MKLSTWLFPLVVIGYFAIALAWPTVRIWIRTGTFPIVFGRERSPYGRIVGLLFGLLIALLFAWSFLVGLYGTEALGCWSVSPFLGWAGWLSIVFGTLVTVIAQHAMGAAWRVGIDDRPTDLVTDGLFRYSRNPIFTGMLITLAGLVLLTPVLWTVVGFVLCSVLISLQVRLEEQHLLTLHGQQYGTYAQRVGRFFPLLGRLS